MSEDTEPTENDTKDSEDNEEESKKDTNKLVLMINKCGRSKNPCRICFQSVSKRSGLQCQGACRKWVHFNCLGYSAGKILDIRSGVITIVCPCPDCSTSIPKEFVTCPPFSCLESGCPANNFPACDSKECPKNSCAPFLPTLPCECVNPSSSSNQDNVQIISSRLSPPCKPPPCKPSPCKPLPCKLPSCKPLLSQLCKPPTLCKMPRSLCKPSNILGSCTKSPCKLPKVTCPPKSCQQSGMKSQSCSCLISGTTIGCECSPISQNNCQLLPDPCFSTSSSTCSIQMATNQCNSDSMIHTLNQLCKTVVNLSEQLKFMVKQAGKKKR